MYKWWALSDAHCSKLHKETKPILYHVRDTRGMCEGHAGDTRVVQYASYRKCRAAGTKEASMGRGSLLKCFGSHAHQLSTWHCAQQLHKEL